MSIQLVDGLDKMSEGETYTSRSSRTLRRDIVSGPRSREITSFRRWLREVWRDHHESDGARGEKYGLPRCVGHLVRCWTLSLNTVPPGNGDGLAVVQSGVKGIGIGYCKSVVPNFSRLPTSVSVYFWRQIERLSWKQWQLNGERQQPSDSRSRTAALTST